MATQLKHIDFTSTTALTPRPNIRVAFIAGEAALALHDTMAKLPAETRDATLDELAAATTADVELIQSMTCSLIETARALLSPAMYTAFLRWGETASHASSYYDSDDEGGMRCAAVADARTLVSDTPADNTHDLLFAMLLTCIETADAPAFGPFDRSYGDFDVNGGELLAGLSRDLRKFSPIPDLVNELSARAWTVSRSRLAISCEVGSAITSAFSFARGENGIEADSTPPLSAASSLSLWDRSYAAFTHADAAMDAYERDHMIPAGDEYPEGMQERYDDLVDVCYNARVALYLTPVPDAAALAIKLNLFESRDDRNLVRANEIVRQLAVDGRRLGQFRALTDPETLEEAQPVQDIKITQAFATRRSEFENAARGPWTQEQEDAYFDRVDAAETVLLNTSAATVEGVIAKLRVSFLYRVGTDWSDLAISNTCDPKFVEGLRMSDMHHRMAWGAIEDLARIGGVNLAEQGA